MATTLTGAAMTTFIEIALWYLWLCCLCTGLVGSIMVWEIRSERRQSSRHPAPNSTILTTAELTSQSS